MSKSSREILKTFFETGDTPSAVQFHQLIDSSLNMIDDGLTVEDKNIGLGVSSPKNKLDIPGNLAVGNLYAGNQKAPSNSLIVQDKIGIGVSNPINKLDVNGSVSIGETYVQDKEAPINGLIVQGKVGIGTPNPKEVLSIDGAIGLVEQEGSPSKTKGYGKLFVKKEKITSILFNGSDNFIEIGQTNEKLKDLKTGTLSMWYKPADSEPRTQQLIWRGSTHSFQIGTGHWVDGYDDESMTVGIYRGGEPELEFYVRRGHNFFTNNQWYHITFVVGENFNKVFIDGIEQSVTYTNGNAQTGNIFLDREKGVDDTIYLGKRVKEGSPPLFTSGYLDEICIIDYPLSNWDVRKLYDNGRKTDLRLEYRQSLVAYWRISETQTLPAIDDFSGNDLHGIFKGTPDENTLRSKEVNTLYFKDGDGNELPLSGTSDAGSVRSLWGQKGSDIYYENGKVGIGTSEPTTSLDINGLVTKKQIAFSVYGDQHISSGSDPGYPEYTRVYVNEGGGWVEGKFTTPIDGLYFFTISYVRDAHYEGGTDDDIFMNLRLNGVAQASAWIGEGDGKRGTASCSVVLDMKKDDYVDTIVISDGGRKRYLRYYYLSGFRL